MSLKVRTFEIREGEAATEDEDRVSSFLRAAAVERIETTFADCRWRLLIFYNDQKDKEESVQIASAIAAALKQWRRSAAQREAIQPGEMLSDEAIATIAQYVPTTPLELRLVLGKDTAAAVPYQAEIVQMVRQTLDALS